MPKIPQGELINNCRVIIFLFALTQVAQIIHVDYSSNCPCTMCSLPISLLIQDHPQFSGFSFLIFFSKTLHLKILLVSQYHLLKYGKSVL